MPVPANEDERIAALSQHHLLDITREPAFDRVARTAADLFGAPTGLVTIILPTTQRFLGSCGIGGEGTRREDSFCTHGILSDGMLVVTDALADPRFAANPAVTGPPGIRFYAGAPLRLSDGIRAGMLCVLDTVPRPMPDPALLDRLMALADITVDLIRMRVGTLTAIEAERRAEAARQELEQRERTIAAQGALLRTALDTVDVGIAVIGPDYRVALSNERYFELLDIPAELRREGVELAEIIRARAGDTASVDGSVEDYIADKLASYTRRENHRFEATTRAGRHLAFQRTAMSDGRFLIAVTDMTEAREAERRKDEFVSTVSHELRTPLTSIAGSLGLLAGGAAGALEPRVRRMVEIAATNSERLVRLINDILDIEKLGSRSIALRFETIEATAAAGAALDGLRGFADGYGVRIALEAPDGALSIRADPDRFAQVVTNLVSNAVKFSPRDGEVRVVLERSPVRGQVRLTVRDQGPGIPAAFRPRLFQRFAQADGSATRQKGGTGLGLAIVQEIVRQHGGTIAVETAEGVGTAFHVDLPAAGEAPQVMICEADPSVAVEIGQRLERAGFRVGRVASPEEALRAASEAEPPALVLVGQQPAGDSAHDLIRALRARPALRDTPILVYAVTAPRGPADPGAAAVEVLDWLEKPADIGRLASAVAQAAPTADAPRRPRVLHLDDDADLLQVAAVALAPIADVVSVTTLAEARAALAQGEVDVVVLDLALEHDCGTDLLPDVARASAARMARVPVVIFSARDAEPRLGAMVDAALTKSRASLEQLVETVRDVARRGGKDGVT